MLATHQHRHSLQQGALRTSAEALGVQRVQGVTQLGGRHSLARCGLLLLPGLPLLGVKLAEQVC